MRILLADDQEEDLRMMESVLAGIAGVDVVGAITNLGVLDRTLRQALPDVVFLDIRFPDRSSLEVVERIRSCGCEVVLVTAFEEYALEAFRLRVRDYLLKPVRRERLVETLGWLEEVVAREPTGWDGEVSLPVEGSWRRLVVESIEWMETRRNYTVLHLDSSEELPCRMPLYRILQRFPPRHDFRQFNRNVAIPLRRVEAILGVRDGRLQVSLDNGYQVSSSRRRSGALRRELQKRFGMDS